MSTKAEQAIAFHDQGYNCAQAVACSFCEEFGVDREEMFKIAEGFGFGMGIMDMCGALSGMMMVIGLQNSVGVPAFLFFILFYAFFYKVFAYNSFNYRKHFYQCLCDALF